MSFLAPIFLAGAAALILPVVFHLIRRSPRTQRVFSSLMFLSPSTTKITRRSRLDHILLLLLRCAILCLLAFAFARPFWRVPMLETPPERPARTSVLLLDVSASMQRNGLWEAARERVGTLVARSAPADQVAVVLFDQQLHPLVTFDEWNATPAGDRGGLVRSRLADTQPGWAGTALDQAVIRSAELLIQDGPGEAGGIRQVVVISDLQEGSRTSDLQTYEWPQDISVRTERLTPLQPGNASLQWMAGTVGEGNLATRLRISNAQDSRGEEFQVGWVGAQGGGFSGEPVSVYVPAGQSRVISLPPTGSTPAATAALLKGDEEPFDNRVFVVPPMQETVHVLYLGKDGGNDGIGPLYFLRRAFPETARQEVRVASSLPEDPVLPGQVEGAALIVATEALTEPTVRQLRAALEQGGTLLFAAGGIACAPTLARLMGVDALSMTEVTPRDYAMLGNIDYRHPLFAPFADERFSDFTGIHFWKYRRIDASQLPDARVLARFDNEDPAWVEVPIGQGRLILLTSGWSPADSQLALSSKFVPLLFSLLELGGTAAMPSSQRFVGDALNLASCLPNNTAVTVDRPDGTRQTLDAKAGATLNPTQPGLYTLVSPEARRQVAVNLDPNEGRTAPLPADELERLGVPGPTAVPDSVRTAQRRVQLHNAELEARQKLWRWTILAVLILLLTETWLAGWTGRRSLPVKEVAV